MSRPQRRILLLAGIRSAPLKWQRVWEFSYQTAFFFFFFFFFSLKSVGMIPCILIRQPMTSTILLCVSSYNSGKVNLLPHKKYIYLLPYEDTLVILVVRLPPRWGLLSCHHADTLNQIRLVSLKAHRIFLHITICKHMLPHHYIQCISPTRDCVPLWGRNHVSFMSSTILNE